MNEGDFVDKAKQEYDNLEQKEKELKDQLLKIQRERKELRGYLITKGVLRKGTRGRKNCFFPCQVLK